MEYLYVLKLEKEKWYVGKTNDIMNRYQQHAAGKGSAWTSKYPPVSLVESKPVASLHDENNVTKDYMKRYGVENVRGGAYTQIVLDDSTIFFLNKEFLGNTDKCFKCGLAGHFANKCSKSCKKTSAAGACYRCGHEGHYSPDCYAKTHKKGYKLESEGDEEKEDDDDEEDDDEEDDDEEDEEEEEE